MGLLLVRSLDEGKSAAFRIPNSYMWNENTAPSNLFRWFDGQYLVPTRIDRLKLGKFKIGLDLTQKQLLITLLNYLATWEKLLGNDRRDPVLLNDYYVRILDLWPCEPYDNPIVRTRSVAAHMHHSNDKTWPPRSTSG